MSLPTKNDQLHDPICRAIEGHINSYHNIHEYSASDPGWSAALGKVEEFLHDAEQRIKRKEHLDKIPTGRVKSVVKALDHLLFDNKIFTDRPLRNANDLALVWWYDPEENGMRKLGEVEVDETSTILNLHAFLHDDAVQLLGTILHEMVHMFVFHCYRAEGLFDARDDNETVRCTFQRLDGEDSHAYLWQKLARAVEDRACRNFGNQEIELRRDHAMFDECMASGIVPAEAYLEEMFSDPNHPKWGDDHLVEKMTGWVEENLRNRGELVSESESETETDD